jgi:hypothetical protein
VNRLIDLLDHIERRRGLFLAAVHAALLLGLAFGAHLTKTQIVSVEGFAAAALALADPRGGDAGDQ